LVTVKRKLELTQTIWIGGIVPRYYRDKKAPDKNRRSFIRG
jgi:hypothetical protein